MDNQPERLVQISDIHLFADLKKNLLGVNTYQSFLALIDLLQNDPQAPTKIILTGDLSQDCSDGSYMHYIKLMKNFSMPIHFIPGNHDNPVNMKKILCGGNFKDAKHIKLSHWQIVLLDSHKPGAVEGFLDKKELDFLENCLSQSSHLNTVVAFHHHPLAVGSTWLDKIGLTNAEELWKILKNYKNIHAVLCGHVHQEYRGEKHGIKVLSVPSTCIQFKRNCEQFFLENLPPGYRWLDLYPNGELKTGINRLNHYVGKFQEKATGY